MTTLDPALMNRQWDEFHEWGTPRCQVILSGHARIRPPVDGPQ
jgi:hypothetical protein